MWPGTKLPHLNKTLQLRRVTLSRPRRRRDPRVQRDPKVHWDPKGPHDPKGPQDPKGIRAVRERRVLRDRKVSREPPVHLERPERPVHPDPRGQPVLPVRMAYLSPVMIFQGQRIEWSETVLLFARAHQPCLGVSPRPPSATSVDWMNAIQRQRLLKTAGPLVRRNPRPFHRMTPLSWACRHGKTIAKTTVKFGQEFVE